MHTEKIVKLIILLVLLIILSSGTKEKNNTLDIIFNKADSIKYNADKIIIIPKEYTGILRNPMMGPVVWNPHHAPNDYKYVSVINLRRNWNEIENKENDSPTKIIEHLNNYMNSRNLKDDQNYSVRYRIKIHDAPDKDNPKGLPSDLPVAEYLNQTPYFQKRCEKLIQKMGMALDGDPRICAIEVGLIGKWGEGHNPNPTASTDKVIREAFTKYFKKTPIVRRTPDKFDNIKIGMHNDSFGTKFGGGIEGEKNWFAKYPKTWKDSIVRIGEVSTKLYYRERAPNKDYGKFSWNRLYKDQITRDIYESDIETKYFINHFRYSHMLAMGHFDPILKDISHEGTQNMISLFNEMGYRFHIKEFSYKDSVQQGQPFIVKLKVVNTAVSRFPQDWPLELSLLNEDTGEPVWRETFKTVDIRKWTGGEDFPPIIDENYDQNKTFEYQTPAPIHVEAEQFTIDRSIPDGRYIIALAILDTKNRPAVKFATSNYFNGALHPMGYIGIGTSIGVTEIDSMYFDNPFNDPYCTPTIKKITN